MKSRSSIGKYVPELQLTTVTFQVQLLSKEIHMLASHKSELQIRQGPKRQIGKKGTFILLWVTTINLPTVTKIKVKYQHQTITIVHREFLNECLRHFSENLEHTNL